MLHFTPTTCGGILCFLSGRRYQEHVATADRRIRDKTCTIGAFQIGDYWLVVQNRTAVASLLRLFRYAQEAESTVIIPSLLKNGSLDMYLVG